MGSSARTRRVHSIAARLLLCVAMLTLLVALVRLQRLEANGVLPRSRRWWRERFGYQARESEVL